MLLLLLLLYLLISSNFSEVWLCVSFQDMVAEMCLEYFQRYRRQAHVTPKSYLSFIAGYKTIYDGKRQEIGQLAERMNTGQCNHAFINPSKLHYT